MPRVASAPKRGGSAALLKGAGLVAVAVVAGLIWWLVRHEPDEPVAQAPAKEFSFVAAAGPVVSTDCAAKSSDAVKKWFGGHPCQKLSRSLYATSAGNARALVSVAVVTMPSEADAQELKKLVDTDGTGNVSDLVRDGSAKLPDAPTLASGEYTSRVTGSQVAIVLAGFYGDHNDPPTLGRVAAEALDLAPQVGK